MSDSNPYLEKLTAKYGQLKAKLKENKADVKIQADLEGKINEVKKALEELKTAAADQVETASKKTQDAIDSLEKKINDWLDG